MLSFVHRSLLNMAILMLALSALLAGCGKQPDPAVLSAPAASAASSTNQASARPAPLKIAFAYVGPVGDGGWTFAHDNGRKAIEKAFGDKVVTSFVENIPESADVDNEFRKLVAQNNQLIFGTTFGYGPSMLRVARDNPSVRFEHATGNTRAANLRTYASRTYESAYMAGVIAGQMTRSKVLGVVASIPIPEVFRNINSFALGAQSSNPQIKVKVVWVHSWFDPSKEARAAAQLVDAGADVLFQNTDSPAVLKTAQTQGVRAFGWDSDMTAYAPKAHLASCVISWGPYYIWTIRQALDGHWSGNADAWWGVKEGAIDLVSIASDVPADTVARVQRVKKGLIDGSFAIWKGPIIDNTGRQVLADGVVADDAFLNQMHFWVRGVLGRLPDVISSK